jgi:hypothetical protein
VNGPETRLRKRMVKKLQEKYPNGLFTKIHVSVFANAGIPDLICCVEGLYIGIEIKVPGRKASPNQEFYMSRIRRAGGSAGVATTVEEILQIVDEALKKGRRRR